MTTLETKIRILDIEEVREKFESQEKRIAALEAQLQEQQKNNSEESLRVIYQYLVDRLQSDLKSQATLA